MRTNPREALIIGCGIAGPVVAMALQRAGLSATLYEARAEPAPHVGAFLNLAPNGLNALGALGLDAQVKAAGFACTGMVFRNSRGKRIGEMDGGSDAQRYGTAGIIIKRGLLHQVLLEEAVRRGIRVEFGKKLEGLQVDAGRSVTARFEDGTQARGELLLGCDGLHSRTRRLLLPDAPAPTYTKMVGCGGFLPNTLGLPPSSTMHMTFGKRAFFGYFVPTAGEIFWFNNLPQPEEPSRGALSSLSAEEWRRRLLEVHAEDPSPIPDILRAMTGEIGQYPIHDIPFLPTWHQGPVCLVGDAAHATSPHAGQGASLAIEDALVLARCLRDVPDVARAFAAYEGLRKERVEKLVRQGRRNGDMKPGASPLADWVRDLLMPFFLKLGTRTTDGTYSYRIDWEQKVVF
ncbi:FAD-dependent oxidoreductase [Archangium lansingense]|uniref:FAD-dependent monooxygenase n=1 Tax=Archangium lansingense TaxID=2995310 RepID=A0ABT4AME4_9BACT|nr:FAD-dependent monooxygenase [Archangium lansinium]MCY1082825.1 FAD-dependent monooxygenase [Archangium lansinium]